MRELTWEHAQLIANAQEMIVISPCYDGGQGQGLGQDRVVLSPTDSESDGLGSNPLYPITAV